VCVCVLRNCDSLLISSFFLVGVYMCYNLMHWSSIQTSLFSCEMTQLWIVKKMPSQCNAILLIMLVSWTQLLFFILSIAKLYLRWLKPGNWRSYSKNISLILSLGLKAFGLIDVCIMYFLVCNRFKIPLFKSWFSHEVNFYASIDQQF
jgi:hypothetical protein